MLWIHILCFLFPIGIFSRCLLGVEYAYMCSRLLFYPCYVVVLCPIYVACNLFFTNHSSKSFSPPMNWQTEQETSNQMYPGLKKYEKNAPQARFFVTQNLLQAQFIKQNAPQARIFDAVLMGTLSYLLVCKLFFTNLRSKS